MFRLSTPLKVPYHFIHTKTASIQTLVLRATDIAHLIALKKNDQRTFSIDLHVYYENTQFRLFDPTKIDLHNPSTVTLDYPFGQTCIRAHNVHQGKKVF
ncbi:unnamed protein product [Rotaria magnacalcarata]|uniref:Uncharacterized protein n=1 Tax=Rotaria magnacalcarata TaxID=392030 RepID=A0A814IQZ7_9BILA|nr:unnamed protein product [Rotaria magnacalcarata]